jgi:hypothetical protein
MSDDKPMSEEEIAAARTLCEAATPGPWTFKSPDAPAGAVDIYHPDDGRDDCRVAEWVQEIHEDRNASFIAASRSLVPRLLAEVDRLRADLGRATTERDAAMEHIAILTGAQ